MSTPEVIILAGENDGLVRSRSGHIVSVGNTVLANDVRLQAWDSLQRDNDGDPVRLADLRLTVDQALALVAKLTIAAQNAAASERAAHAIIAHNRAHAAR